MFNNRTIFPDEFRLARISLAELEENLRFTFEMKSCRVSGRIKSAIWFLPHFKHALKGGLRTVFVIAERLSIEWGTQHTIVIDNYFDRALRSDLREHLKKCFPHLRFNLLVLGYSDSPSQLPEADAGFCTLWTTAYTLARYNKCKAKFYVMQDYEPLFYESGSISALIEQTYRLGFYFIANTPGVASKFLQYSDWGMEFIPGVDTDIYYPGGRSVRKNGPFNIIFYGRPENRRNCFILGCEALRVVKNKLGRDVNIISVGAEYSLKSYGLESVLVNRGLLNTMEDVARLYRESDLGISIMTTPHPSYQPLEYMASGCPAVTNINELNNWLYKDQENIVLSEPIYNIMAERIINALEESSLRERLIEGGLRTISSLDWDTALKKILNYINNPSKFNT